MNTPSGRGAAPAASETTLVLLHSPLVGPASWEPVAEVLRARGRAVVAPSLAAVFDGPGPHLPGLVATAATAAAEAGGPLVLVAHSGAGVLLPAVAAALADAPVRGLVYADALLPEPGRSWFDTAPPELAQRLRDLAEDGVLPPWDEWFPAGAVAGLLPDESQRARFRAGLPRLPLSYFEEPAPVVDASAPSPPAGYLQLSEGYTEQAARAERDGWPVVRRAAHHLAPLTEPGMVAEELTRLAEIR